MPILDNREQEKCKTNPGLFEVSNEEFKPQHNETIVLLQYCTLVGGERESAEECIGCLKVEENECKY